MSAPGLPDLQSAAEDDRLVCRCGSPIGELVAVQRGVQLLHIGDVLIREAHSMFCIHCGSSIHWSVSDRREERRIKAELKARNTGA
jgi:hypothetical protein